MEWDMIKIWIPFHSQRAFSFFTLSALRHVRHAYGRRQLTLSDTICTMRVRRDHLTIIVEGNESSGWKEA